MQNETYAMKFTIILPIHNKNVADVVMIHTLLINAQVCKGTLPAAGLQLSEGKVFKYRAGREGALADS